MNPSSDSVRMTAPETVLYTLNLSIVTSLELGKTNIAALIPKVVAQCPFAKDDVCLAEDTLNDACAALQGLDFRQIRGTQYLKSIDALFNRVLGMLDVFEKLLQNHLSGGHGSVIVWHAQEGETVRGLTMVSEACASIMDLLLSYNETFEARSAMSASDQMASYSRIVEEVTNRKKDWLIKCKGRAFDPEPIRTLLDMVGRQAREHLKPGNFSSPPTRNLSSHDEDAPPAYETVVEASKEPLGPSQGQERLSLKQGDSGCSISASAPGPSKQSNKQPTDSRTLSPRQIIAIPRRSRQNERVRVSLTPECSRIVVYSVDSLELYSAETATLLWRIGSDDNRISKKGFACQFLDLMCFSPDGSLLCFMVETGYMAAKLVVIRARDGEILGKKSIIASQVLSVCFSNSNRKIALCCTSAEKTDFGCVKLLSFDPQVTNGFLSPELEMIQIKPGKPLPNIRSCFSPDDSHLIVVAERFDPITNSRYGVRTNEVRVFEVKGRVNVVKHWQTSLGNVLNQVPSEPEFIFPRDDATGKHKWLVAWNGDDGTDPDTFKLGDIVHQEVLMSVKEGHQSLSFRQFLGTLTRKPIWARVRFADNGTFTHMVRRGKKGQGKITLTRGRWDKDGMSSTMSDMQKSNPATTVEVDADDDWQPSNDGKLAVTYNKSKGRVELWSL